MPRILLNNCDNSFKQIITEQLLIKIIKIKKLKKPKILTDSNK